MSKEVAKKTKKTEEVEESKEIKKLTSDEMSKMAIRAEAARKEDLEISNLMLQRNIKNEQKENLRLKIKILELEDFIIGNKIIDFKKIQYNNKQDYNKLIDNIKERLEIKSTKFGFDDDTGEIIEE